MEKRTLYDCLEAKVNEERIKCAKGYSFNSAVPDGSIRTHRLVNGAPLEISTCQQCSDFSEMDGGTVQQADRGWDGAAKNRQSQQLNNGGGSFGFPRS